MQSIGVYHDQDFIHGKAVILDKQWYEFPALVRIDRLLKNVHGHKAKVIGCIGKLYFVDEYIFLNVKSREVTLLSFFEFSISDEELKRHIGVNSYTVGRL